MIRHVNGTVRGHEGDALIVDVQGIGYLVNVSLPLEQFPLEQEVQLHTHLAVRETSHDLYGFPDRDSLEVFELLLTLPKIGPKTAIQILRKTDVALLKRAIINDDATYLSKMSGIGKKVAEKIVTGLKDKFDTLTADTDRTTQSGTESYMHDTIDALIALGYPESDARKTVRKLSETNPEIITSPDALKAALKTLSN